MRQIQFTDIGHEYDVQIISSDNQQYLRIDVALNGSDYFTHPLSGNFRTAQMLSEALRDAIGYGPAVEVLKRQNVPEGDPLYYLGGNN